MHPTLKSLIQQATQLTRAGKLAEATAAIQRALGGGTAPQPAPANPQLNPGRVFDMEMPAAPVPAPAADGAVADAPAPTPAAAPAVSPNPAPDITSRAPDATPAPDRAAPAPRQPAPASDRAAPTLERRAADSPQQNDDPGQFISVAPARPWSHAARPYKLYVPPRHAGRALPLVVMLHGCTQNPDDFAAGTGMNQRAREQGFFVLYAEQTRQANPTLCWNWFKPEHQRRGGGEPALLAGMVQEVAAQYGIDPRRVYIAGLSAGGAMAAITAAEYPDVFAAVGVHSGLPRGAARNVMGALAVMRSGGSAAAPAAPAADAPLPVPAIIFHGDADRTVHPRNGERLAGAALRKDTAAPQVSRGTAGAGRGYTRSVHAGPDGAAVAEHWLVHGMGHAWSGGSTAGTYTDASGPDATAEMLRFFFMHTLARADAAVE